MKISLRALTLLELLIAMILLSFFVLSFYLIASFSHYHVSASDRRAKIQNELSLTLEHMNKNVLQGIGNVSQPLPQPPLEIIANGFRVRVDRNNPPTPQDLTDDTWINYVLSGNTLSCTLNNEVLSDHIIANVVFGPLPANPASGFYINLTDNATAVEIGLVARFRPAAPVSLDNPQLVMKSRLYTRSAAAR